MRKRTMAITASLATATILIGSILLDYSQTAPQVDPEEVEVGFAPLAAESTAGTNQTNATANVVGSLVGNDVDALSLNNTNATSPWFVKLTLTSSNGLLDITSAAVGIDNGTATSDQIVITLASVSQSEGTYVRLEPASTNTIYATTLVGGLFAGATLDMDVRIAEATNESAYYDMKASISLT